MLTGIDVVNKHVRIDTEHVQRQHNGRVTTEILERVAIYTGLGQGLVAKRVTATLTNRLGDTGLHIIFDRQVQDVLYTVVAGCIFDGLYITICLIVLVITPSVRQFAATNRNVLLVYNHLKISINSDGTITSCGRLIVERMRLTGGPEYPFAIGARERGEGDTFGAVVYRINGQMQDIDRIHTLCRIVVDIDGVVERAGVEVVLSTPIVVVTLTDGHLVRMRVRYRGGCFVADAQAVDTVATEVIGMTLFV